MRCLNCGKDALPINTEICPRCSVYLPALMRDLLAPGYLLNRYRIDYPYGQKIARDLGYVPLPPNVIKRVEAAIDPIEN